MNHEIFIIVLPVFLVIGLGFCLKRGGLVEGNFLFNLNRLIYYIALPALLFYKIATADFNQSFNGTLLGCLVLNTVAIFGLSYIFASFRSYSPAVQGAFCQGSFRGNLAYIGLAIVNNAYGKEGFAIAGVLLGFLVPLLNFLSVVALIFSNHRDDSQLGRSSWFRQVIHNPLIIASFCGISWSFLELPFPEIVDRALSIVTGMSLPLALISIGASFSFKKLRGDLMTAFFSTGFKIVLSPIVAGCLLFSFGIRGQELAIGVLLAGTPTATAAYIMAEQLGGDAELSGTIIMLSTICSLVTYTLALYVLGYIGG